MSFVPREDIFKTDPVPTTTPHEVRSLRTTLTGTISALEAFLHDEKAQLDTMPLHHDLGMFVHALAVRDRDIEIRKGTTEQPGTRTAISVSEISLYMAGGTAYPFVSHKYDILETTPATPTVEPHEVQSLRTTLLKSRTRIHNARARKNRMEESFPAREAGLPPRLTEKIVSGLRRDITAFLEALDDHNGEGITSYDLMVEVRKEASDPSGRQDDYTLTLRPVDEVLRYTGPISVSTEEAEGPDLPGELSGWQTEMTLRSRDST